MSNLNTENQPNDYNKVPVLYCKHCLSLKIRNIPRMRDSDYCDECGSTDIGECSIEEWKLYTRIDMDIDSLKNINNLIIN